MDLLDSFALAIYLESRRDSHLPRRLQITKAYEEAEDILITRAVYLQEDSKDKRIAVEPLSEQIACVNGYARHLWDGTQACTRCSKDKKLCLRIDAKLRRLKLGRYASFT